MVDSQYSGCTIGGSPVVDRRTTDRTADEILVTADGNLWQKLTGGVPSTIPTGAVISTLTKDQRQ